MSSEESVKHFEFECGSTWKAIYSEKMNKTMFFEDEDWSWGFSVPAVVRTEEEAVAYIAAYRAGISRGHQEGRSAAELAKRAKDHVDSQSASGEMS